MITWKLEGRNWYPYDETGKLIDLPSQPSAEAVNCFMSIMLTDEKKTEKKIEWCKLGYTEEEAKEKCPLGGCWKYRCMHSKLNEKWHENREKWRRQRYG